MREIYGLFGINRKKIHCKEICTRQCRDEKLQIILEATCFAPVKISDFDVQEIFNFSQPHQLIISHSILLLLLLLYTKGRDDELNRIYPAEWFVQPPIVICVCTIPDEAWSRRNGKNYVDVDATIVMDQIILTAPEHETCKNLRFLLHQN